jgi:hypothetical protein
MVVAVETPAWIAEEENRPPSERVGVTELEPDTTDRGRMRETHWMLDKGQLQFRAKRPGWARFKGGWMPNRIAEQLSNVWLTDMPNEYTRMIVPDFWTHRVPGKSVKLEGLQWWHAMEFTRWRRTRAGYPVLRCYTDLVIRPSGCNWAFMWLGSSKCSWAVNPYFEVPRRNSLTNIGRAGGLSDGTPRTQLMVPDWLYEAYQEWVEVLKGGYTRTIPWPYVAFTDGGKRVHSGNGGPGAMCWGQYHPNLPRGASPLPSDILASRGRCTHKPDLIHDSFIWDPSPLREGLEELTKVMQQKHKGLKDSAAYRLHHHTVLQETITGLPAWGLKGQEWMEMTTKRRRDVELFEPTTLKVRVDLDQMRGAAGRKPGVVRYSESLNRNRDIITHDALVETNPSRALDVLARRAIIQFGQGMSMPPSALRETALQLCGAMDRLDYELYWAHMGGWSRFRRRWVEKYARELCYYGGNCHYLRLEQAHQLACIEAGEDWPLDLAQDQGRWQTNNPMEERLWRLGMALHGDYPADATLSWWALVTRGGVANILKPYFLVRLGGRRLIDDWQMARDRRGYVEMPRPTTQVLGKIYDKLGKPGGAWQSRTNYPKTSPNRRPTPVYPRREGEEMRGIQVSAGLIPPDMRAVGWEWQDRGNGTVEFVRT